MNTCNKILLRKVKEMANVVYMELEKVRYMAWAYAEACFA